MEHTSPYRLTLLVCLAEILGLASIAAFPALLPTFQFEWDLNNTAAGWISAAYYGGYMVLVPVLAGEINNLAGWRWAFAASAFSTVAALVIIVLFIPPGKVRRGKNQALLSDFKVVLRSPSTMAYVLGYAAHMWELFSMRSWIVAFLAFSIQLQPADAVIWSPTRIAFIINLIGLPASIGGNELSRIFDRPKVIGAVMIGSAVLVSVLGLSASLPYAVVAIMAILHGITVVGDSASLTAGVVAAAPAGFRGTTLAVHSTIGFGAAFLGPLTVGVVLDLFGGGQTGWAMAAGCLLGPIFLTRAERKL